MVKMQQVHGNNVVRVSSKDDGKTIQNCDALITGEKNLKLCVRVADCLPIFLTDKKGRALGLIHAGWRGLSNGIINNTIELMQKELKIRNSDLEVYIGPHICQKHYEVKEDVASKFTFKDTVFKGRRTFLDLGAIAKQQFVDLGVKNENITIDSTCTFESKDLFSFRRNGTDKRNLYLMKI